MELALIGIGAFIILGIVALVLWHSSRHENDDPVTQEIIIKGDTGPVRTQEKDR